MIALLALYGGESEIPAYPLSSRHGRLSYERNIILGSTAALKAKLAFPQPRLIAFGKAPFWQETSSRFNTIN